MIANMEKDYRLGELLVRMRLIDEGELRAMLSLQAELRAHHRSRSTGMGDKRFGLGTLLVESGLIDEPVLEDVLAHLGGDGSNLAVSPLSPLG